MRDFFTAILLIMVIKGVFYILFPNKVGDLALILEKTPAAQLILFGWMLVLGAAWAWLGYVRGMPY